MKRLLILLILLLPTTTADAQSRRDALLEYRNRRNKALTNYRDNYRKAYADYLRKRWEARQSLAPLPVPERKEPEQSRKPQADSSDGISAPSRLPYNRIADRLLGQSEQNEQNSAPPLSPDSRIADATPARRPYAFEFYRTPCSVTLTDALRFRLLSTAEQHVADVWELLSDGRYDALSEDCLALKRQLNLNDWGYYELVRTVCEGFCGAGTNESVVLQAFLMAERGYRVRLARADGKLLLLLAVEQLIYQRRFVELGGERFYVADPAKQARSFSICDFSIPNERSLSLTMPTPPLFADALSEPSKHETGEPRVSTTVRVNTNLMDFYTNYPVCHWSVYAATGLSPDLRRSLYPVLETALAGKNETEAVRTLLRYLHAGFDYRTDDAQFGHERTLFAEESFYYPYSDCEDRSILFSRLVYDLLGLDVVLLYYPDHIATAVRFSGQVDGDYLQIGNRRYLVCDPTYIGADIGRIMPQYRNAAAEIIPIR